MFVNINILLYFCTRITKRVQKLFGKDKQNNLKYKENGRKF